MVLAASIPGILVETLTFLLVRVVIIVGPIALVGVDLVEWILIWLFVRRARHVVVTRDWFVPRMYMNSMDGPATATSLLHWWYRRRIGARVVIGICRLV